MVGFTAKHAYCRIVPYHPINWYTNIITNCEKMKFILFHAKIVDVTCDNVQ